jgi:uncharacterized membrane protein YeiB
MPPDSSGVVAAPPAPSEAPAPLAPADRITGYDLARALAILGMVLVHFTLVMSFERLHEDWLSHVVEFLDGRAAATFVVLAGVGLPLRSRRAALAGDEASLRGVRVTLIKRALFLLGAGYVNLLIWSGDILRVYGVSLLFAARFLRASNRSLWVLAIGFVAVFVMLFAAFDYSRNWDWRTLEYHGLWTSRARRGTCSTTASARSSRGPACCFSACGSEGRTCVKP